MGKLYIYIYKEWCIYKYLYIKNGMTNSFLLVTKVFSLNFSNLFMNITISIYICIALPWACVHIYV